MPTDPDALFETLQRLQAGRRLPPVDSWHPTRTGRIDIRIARDGTWYHDGVAFKRLALVRLFSTILRREESGYFLVTPGEKFPIDVEDAPFLAVDMVARGEGDEQEIGFRTSTDDVVFAGPGHRVWIEPGDTGPRPYVHVRAGLNALIARSVYYPLVELADESNGRLWLRSGGERFDLGSVG